MPFQLYVPHLSREYRKLQRGIELVPGLLDGADRLIDFPNGLVLRVLQPQLQPALFQQGAASP